MFLEIINRFSIVSVKVWDEACGLCEESHVSVKAVRGAPLCSGELSVQFLLVPQPFLLLSLVDFYLHRLSWRTTDLRPPIEHLPIKCKPYIYLSNFRSWWIGGKLRKRISTFQRYSTFTVSTTRITRALKSVKEGK